MQLLDYEDLKAKGIKYSKPHIWRLVKAGQFPQPIKLGNGRNTWVEEELDSWIKMRMAARDHGEIA